MNLRDVLDPVSWRRSFEGPEELERLRNRVLAASGMWFLLVGFLATLGFAVALFASLALLLVGVFVAGALWLQHRYRAGRGVRLAVRWVEGFPERVKPRLDGLGPRQRAPRIAEVAGDRARAFVAGGRRTYGTAVGRVRTSALQLTQRNPANSRPEREALRLNALGVRLRREGNYEAAVGQHEAALAVVRELGDRRAEALTLNNLALALVHTRGGVRLAVEHFEEAAALLRDLGDEEHEGRVIANLGFVRRRQGRDEDAVNLLHAALDKLPPDSSAYHQVEKHLRRAS